MLDASLYHLVPPALLDPLLHIGLLHQHLTSILMLMLVLNKNLEPHRIVYRPSILMASQAPVAIQLHIMLQ
jgi:hypothetical protein